MKKILFILLLPILLMAQSKQDLLNNLQRGGDISIISASPLSTHYVLTWDGDEIKIVTVSNLGGVFEALIGDNLTLENGEIIANATDGDLTFTFNDDDSTLAQMFISSSIDSPYVNPNDVLELVFQANDDSSGMTDWATFEVMITDSADESEDSKISFKVYTAGTETTPLALIGEQLTLANNEAISNATDGTIAFTDGSNNLMTIVDNGTTGNVTITGQGIISGNTQLNGTHLDVSTTIAGQDTFATTASADTVVISGALESDLYFLTGVGGSVDQQDVLQAEAKADTLIVHRLASGASDLVYNWFRVR